MSRHSRLQVLHSVQLGEAVPGFTMESKQWVKQEVSKLCMGQYLCIGSEHPILQVLPTSV